MKALELAYTALARMAAANSNGDEAMKAAEEGLRAGVPARLRAFVPALLAYAVAGEVDKAFQVQWFHKTAAVCMLLHEAVIAYDVHDMCALVIMQL